MHAIAPPKTKTKKKKKSHTFVLKDVDVTQVDTKFGLAVTSNIDYSIPAPENTTKIDDLTSHTRKQKNYYPFVNSAAKHYITMVDYKSGEPNTGTCCFWCRHAFDHIAIGCPLRYVSSDVYKECTSEITKEKYTIFQKITPKTREKLGETFSSVKKEYYVTDGIFCSFNCCLAFIRDKCPSPEYGGSETLLKKMYVRCFSVGSPEITAAPSWRLLREYGGFMTIDEFRHSFSTYVYIYTGYKTEKKFPKILPVGHVFEENYIF